MTQALRKTLFILIRSDRLRDFAVFNSEYGYFPDDDRKYVVKIVSLPIMLCHQVQMVCLMSRKDVVAPERRTKVSESPHTSCQPG